jgi:NitT/TauT family transport system permease protein
MKLASALLSAALALLLWSAVAAQVGNPLLLPRPADVAGAAAVLWHGGELTTHVLASLQRLLVGLAVGTPIGATLGCLMGISRTADAMLDPYVRFFNAIPALAIVPFSLIALGVTELSRYALLVYTVTLVVLLGTRQGVRGIPRIRLNAGATLGLGRTATLFRIVMPSAFPAILAGVRTAMGLGVMVIVAAEMLGAESGLGYLIMQARSHFSVANMLVGVIGLGLLSLLLDRAFLFAIETLLPRWSLARRI